MQSKTPPDQQSEPSQSRANAPLAPPDNQDDQLTATGSAGQANDKEIEVVRGDSLWQIARTHLTEKTGNKPSDAEILKLVDQIVERNNIQNPDLIYPGEKFVIPGDA